jgi:hypothetical protein
MELWRRLQVILERRRAEIEYGEKAGLHSFKVSLNDLRAVLPIKHMLKR